MFILQGNFFLLIPVLLPIIAGIASMRITERTTRNLMNMATLLATAALTVLACALPALGNEFIVLLKETSVCGYIALQDLTKGGDIIRSQTYDAFLPLIAVALIYLIVVVCLSQLLKKLENSLKKNER